MTRPSLRLCIAALAPLLAGGCNLVVMNPAGDVARQQADLILWAFGLMMLIIVPVMILTVVFAFKYRATNEDAEYRPDWDHSTGLELVIWSAPLAIIIALGAITWFATHTLDPYRPLDRIAAGKPVNPAEKPLVIDVVSLDWKWLFIYPEQGIATVNELVVPANRQVEFRMTSSSVMNTFHVPAMAGMVYTMPGMQTQLHAVLNRTGRFDGKSANYSGAGFSYMNFWTYAMDDAGFAGWVAKAKAAPQKLDVARYLQLEKPSENVAPAYFGGVDGDLFRRILEMCVHPGETCMTETMRHDMGEPGSHPPVNDVPMRPGEPKGALMRKPEEHKPAPSMTAPHGPAKGNAAPGDDSNRNMTLLDHPRLPGAGATASA